MSTKYNIPNAKIEPSESLNNLLFRRQFILSSQSIPSFPDWKSFRFGELNLKVHPDLESTVLIGNNREFLLLGFALSHCLPEANNQDLLDELAKSCDTIDKMLDFCRDLCGRYILLFNINGDIGVVNDLIGSRTVYYSFVDTGIWCASQPNMIAALSFAERDPSPATKRFIEKELFASGEGCWIGEETIFLGVKHLLPNHYLDLKQKIAIRYWPKNPNGKIEVENASVMSASILENTILSATNRFRLSMAITAGWDSRCLLAATRKVQQNIFFYIQKYGKMSNHHPDIRVPRKLTKKIGLPFNIIECKEYDKPTFNAILEKNVFLLHNQEKKVLYYNFFEYFKGFVNASGNISDLCRNIYGIEPVTRITDLLVNVNLHQSEYAINGLENWFSQAKILCDRLGYNLRDIFFWEQVLGNWGSMFPAELDIAIEEFYPFGTRRLVELILAVDQRLRPYTNSEVHRRIIQILWPDLLTEPINPIPGSERLLRSIKRIGNRSLVTTGLLSSLKKIHSKVSQRLN